MSVDYLKANENIVEDSKNLLLWQFENATNLQKMVEIIAEESSGYEQVAEKIFTGFLLASAEGVALDSIGEFLNFPRDGQSDAEYRTALVFSSIGAQSTIARDDVTNLINIVTGGIGGYFYRGRYHDLYIYLQQSCIDKGVATEFIDQYLPINTNASIIFESGNSFGFEGNDAAAGFDRVRALPAEGEVALQYALEDLDVPAGVVIPNGDTFTDSLDNIYRTDGDTDLETTMRGFKWDVSDHSNGDVVGFTARNNFDGSTEAASFTIQSDATSEIAFEVAKVLVENNTVPAESVYLSEGAVDTLYVGYELLTDVSLFSSRSTQATEYNSFQEQATIVAIDVARKTYDATTGDAQAVFYENVSKNLLPHGNYPDDVTGDWTVAGTVAAQGVDATLQYINGISSVTYDLAIGASVSVSKAVLTERVGLHSFSFYLLPDVLTYTVSSRANSYVFSYDGTSVTDVSSDFNSSITSPVIIEGQDCLRVTITDEYSLAEDADLEISAIADQGVAATLQITCAQFEPWSVATSYIPTQGGAQERAVDIFALTEDPAFDGAVEDHTFIFNDAKGDVTLWSQGTLVAAYKELRTIPATTVFTPVESYDFTLLSTTALSGWSEGFGDEGALIDDDVSYSESGRLCSRASLTSRDVLGLTEIGDSTIGVFEYELDSRFAEVISFVSTEDSYARPIIALEQFREFRSPDWDNTVIDPLDPTKVLVSGVALRSPQATTQVASPETSMKRFLAKVGAGDVFSYTNNVGDINVPNTSFYFELQLTSSVASSAIDELYASADFSARQETTEASVVTTSDTTFRAALVSEYRETTSDYEVSVYVVAVNRTSTVNQVSGESSELDYEVVGKPYSQVYSDPLNAEAITAGFVVDPVQNIVRLYIDGQSYDGNSGIVLVTSLGANHNDAETIVGDVLTIPVTTDVLLFQVGGSTNADKPEPTSVVDYGSIRFNYSQEHFQYVEQLPQNTLDIFGRVIDNGA